ncbi:MAG: hypothetical protein QM652_08190 [Legionella sp.]
MFVVAILKDKDQIVTEVIKYLAIFGSGLFGGYSWGTKAKKSTHPDGE